MLMSLTDRSTHFEFGENWLSYTETIDEEKIARAERSLNEALRLDVKGRSFLDIGCGSGLFSLAALRLGAARVQCIDVDENSVMATRRLLSRCEPAGNWKVEAASILDLPQNFPKNFDIVYSWGVLHHTGAMWSAIKCASGLVAKGGHLVLALYRKTMLCPFWTLEKRLYTNHPLTFAPVANAVFRTAWVSGQLLTGRNTLARIRSYHSRRGMSWSHDVHDWLGGYPYESASFDDVVTAVSGHGFDIVHSNARRGYAVGVFGSGCD